jgi:capsular polysaccharide biosynthesis protein
MIPRRLKRPLSTLLAWGPWSSRLIGPPKGGVVDTPASEPTSGVLAVRDIEGGHAHPPPPWPADWPWIEAALLAELHRTLCPEIKALRVGHFRDARYFQPTFAVIDARDRIQHEFSQGWEKGARGGNYAFEEVRLKKPLTLKGRALLLDARTHSQNYFHWLIEALPRVEFARMAGWSVADFDHVLVSGGRRPFHLETLAVAGIDPAKLVDTATHRHVACDELVAVSDLRMFAYDATIAALGKFFARQIEAGKMGAKKRFFVSRADATSRLIENEDELFARLERLGFTRVTLGRRSVAEQAGLFAQAEVIVAAHGAALSNLVFCPRGAVVVEIHYPRYTLGLYWQIAQRLGLRYGAVRGLAIDDGSGDPRQANMTVDAAATAAYVADLLRA